MIGREINFKTDKYNDPIYLSKRESIAQVINNGLFMKLGNCPSHPDRGVDIEQYLNKPVDFVNENKILADLKRTCGEALIGSDVSKITFNMIKDGDREIALLIVSVTIDNTEDLMAIAIQREKDNVVRYNYSFINEDVPT